MNDLKVTGTLIIDALEAARAFEEIAGQYLAPVEQAAYLPGEMEPAFTTGGAYYQYVDGQQVWITSLQDIRSDVYQGRDELAFEYKNLDKLMPYPNLPVRGLKIVKAVVDNAIRNHSAWTRKRKNHVKRDTDEAMDIYGSLRQSRRQVEMIGMLGVKFLVDAKVADPKMAPRDSDEVIPMDSKISRAVSSLGSVLHDFIRDDLRYSLHPETHLPEPNYDLRNNLSIHLIDLRTQVMRFLGDDRWIMHFIKEQGTDIVVTKTIDYRIYAWMIEHGDEYEP